VITLISNFKMGTSIFYPRFRKSEKFNV